MTHLQEADLHVHTTASDGTLTPREVVREAVRAGLAAVGIADHDTVDGVAPGLEAGRSAGLIVVPAVEINTDFGKGEIHILGYYIDHESAALKNRLESLRAGRLERAERIVGCLNDLGLKVSMDRVKEIADNAPIGRPHIARAITEAGYAPTISAAFGKYLVRGAPAYIPRYKLTPFEAMEIIHDAGGVAVLAHPGLNSHDELIPKLVDAGLQGIEVYHCDHSPAQAAHYMEIARRYDLIPTGGSDSHGPNNIKTVAIGSVRVDIAIAHRLRAAAKGSRGLGV
ncbi:MAG TPA: PHP domain-containing protein [Armatimonadota bacterium]|nr:PHP domain-containing protein [Armatimonadota bacterium]